MSSADPGRARAVRVLVAEVADPPGRLSGCLAGAGHRVVARAATTGELARLVQIAQPEVAVFDAEVSAETVAAFRVSEPTVGVVVVWPEGTYSGSAHEHVPPARIQRDLAGAVRRAVPADALPPVTATSPPAPGVPTASGATWLGRAGLELAVAATLTFLLVVAAVTFRVTQGGGATTLAADATAASALPSVSVPGTNVPALRPEPPSGPATGPPTITGESPRISAKAASTGVPSSAPIAGEPVPTESATTEPASTEPASTEPASTEPAPGPPPPDGAFLARQEGNGPMTFARQQACREATARLGIVGAAASMRRVLERCVVSDPAGLLRALARVLGPGGALPGRGADPAERRGGPGGAPGRGVAADHRQDGSGHKGTPSGRGPSSNGHASDHRPAGTGPGHGHAGNHGPGHSRGKNP
jgi:hypothetical protein